MTPKKKKNQYKGETIASALDWETKRHQKWPHINYDCILNPKTPKSLFGNNVEDFSFYTEQIVDDVVGSHLVVTYTGEVTLNQTFPPKKPKTVGTVTAIEM